MNYSIFLQLISSQSVEPIKYFKKFLQPKEKLTWLNIEQEFIPILDFIRLHFVFLNELNRCTSQQKQENMVTLIIVETSSWGGFDFNCVNKFSIFLWPTLSYTTLISIVIVKMSGQRKSSLPLQNFKDLPVQNEKRTCSDRCCLIIGFLFSLIIIVTASVLFSKSTFISVNYPTDSDGKLCGYDLPEYQYVYFSAAPLITPRVCVSKCPSKGDLSLSCKPNSAVTSCDFSPLNKYMQTLAEETRYGFFCWPVQKTITQKIKETAGLLVRQDFFQSLDAVKITLLAALGFSIIFLFCAHCFTSCLNYLVVPASGIAILVATVLVFAFKTNETGVRAVIGVVLIIILAMLIVSVYKNSISIKIHSVFLRYASKLIGEHYSLVLFVLLYLIFLVLLIGLIMFQFVGFWSNGRKIFLPAEFIYYKLEGITVSSVVTIVLIIQMIWGVAFLKQSFNFCLSGNAITWYFQEAKQEKNGICFPLGQQITKHLGSVIACAFMTSFFSLFDFLFDLIKPVNTTGQYASCFNSFCGCFVCLWDLVRSDAMTMVALTGSPFCNSARYCEYLCNKTPITEYSQSVSRIYSLGAHFFITALSIIFSVFFTNNKSIFALLLIIVGSLTISTFFISLHADTAEAIQIVYLMDQEFRKREKGQSKHQVEDLGLATYHHDLAKELRDVFGEEGEKPLE